MVDMVPWNAHVKAWVDVGLVVGHKPLTWLMDVANELDEYNDYNKWKQALWKKLGEKFKIYSKVAMRKFVVYLNTKVMTVYRENMRRRNTRTVRKT